MADTDTNKSHSLASSLHQLDSGLRHGLDSVQAEASKDWEKMKAQAGKDWKNMKRLLQSSLLRIVSFLFIAMPIVFISLMYAGGYMMSQLSDWRFERGFDFMASAVTGGAIVFPAEPPHSIYSKLLASSAASFGVGIFGFTVAVLGNSLAAPLVQVLGIDVKDDDLNQPATSTGKIVSRLALLALVMMVANICGAAAFGSFLSYMQGWKFWTGFKTMASVALGGGIQFYGMGDVKGPGRLLYTIVGVWSISVASLMIGIAGDPGQKVVSRAVGIRIEEGATASQALRMLAYLVFIILPVTLLLVMLSVASVMAPLTTWEFEGAFWAALPAVSGGAAALSSQKNPRLTMQGAGILICAASAGFFVLSVMLAVGGELVLPIVRGSRLGPYLGKERTVGHSIVALLGISAFLIPALVFVGSLFVGGFMALVQDWPFLDGFWWCVAVQLGGGMQLTDKQVSGLAGMLFGAIAVAWSIGISIVAIGVSGAPVIVPLMDAMGMTIEPEELESLSPMSAVRDVRRKLGESGAGALLGQSHGSTV